MSRSVLIVDDDKAIAENLAEILAILDGGIHIETVATSADALARARSRPIDLALVDIRLPDGDGTTLLRKLQEIDPFIEVILITGDASVETAIAAVSGGAFSYVVKPFAPDELLDSTRRALAQSGLRREREILLRELERSDRRHRELIDAVPAFVIALDGKGNIQVWNQQLEQVTGMARIQMIGRPGRDLVLAGGPRPLPMKNGDQRLVRWETTTVPGSAVSEPMVYAVGLDVTEEQAILRRMLRAERLAAIGTLAAGLAHEVRNPLNSATLQLQVLRRRLERPDVTRDAVVPVIEVVEEEIRRLERLVNEFLAFVRPQPLSRKPTSLDEVCEGVLEFIRPEAEAARVRLVAELARKLPLVSADAERLRQVLLNLVRNGIEAMPDGGTLTLRSSTGPASAPREIQIEVEDTGVGFTDEAPIFDAFFTTKPSGTGLGLSIVHRIVADHGGTVRVRSHPGSTCFTLSLPLDALEPT